MARAPSSGPAGAIWKVPAPILKAVLVVGVVGSTLGGTLLVASVTGASVVRIPALAGPSYARGAQTPPAGPSYAPSARAITISCTSSVPSPIVRILASR